MKTEAQVLAEMLDYNRKQTIGYFNKISPDQYTRSFEVNGKTLNSPLWIIGHLAVTENYLCLRSTGAEIVRFSWAKQFGLGAALPSESEYPAASEILEIFHAVHEASMRKIMSLSDEDLLQVNASGMKFGGDDSVRTIVRHAIAHEGQHAGHLGWLCKLNGVKTI